MRTDGSFYSRFKFDIFVFVVLIFLGMGAFLHHFPLHFSDDDELADSAMPPQIGISETLLILPAQGKSAAQFEDMDFSFAWYNILAQSFGSFNIALSSQIVDDAFNGARIIVIPARTAALFDENQIQLTLNAANKGAIVILEMPTPDWAPLSAVKRKVNTSAAIKRFTDAPNSPLNSDEREQLLNTPLDTKVLRIDGLDSDILGRNDLLLELDGAIAHYRRAIGSGFVYVLAFDLGQAVTALQQGKPNDDFSIESLEGADFPTPANLVLNEKLKTSLVPYADLLKKHVINAALQSYPMPLLWPFPNSAQGALILTQEENGTGENSLYFAKAQEKLNTSSSYFFTSQSLPKESLTQLAKTGFDIGLQVRRPRADSIYSKKGPAFFQPIYIAQNTQKQRTILSNRAKYPVSSCKMQKLAWDDNYFASFKKLAAASCQIDTSYGPSAAKEYGFLFASAYPFLPIDRNGLPLSIYEFPTLFTDAFPVNELSENVAESILEAAKNYNLPAIFNSNADAMIVNPHHSIPTRWVKLNKLSTQYQFWNTNLQQFMHFFSLRRQVHVSTELQNNNLSINIELPPSPYNYTLALASRFNAMPIQNVSVNAVNATDLKSSSDNNFTLLEVPAGAHQILVQWALQ